MGVVDSQSFQNKGPILWPDVAPNSVSNTVIIMVGLRAVEQEKEELYDLVSGYVQQGAETSSLEGRKKCTAGDRQGLLHQQETH